MRGTGEFSDYARLYDLVYRDKETEAEVRWIVSELERWSPGFSAATILELGSGTGRHASVLSNLGHTVVGVEQSQQMIALVPDSAKFESILGDARTVRLGRNFDSVLALFHVVSYQTSDDDVWKLFETAAYHLKKGGLFGFDIWFSPAVHALSPEDRELRIENDELRVIRAATPREDLTRSLVAVDYRFDVVEKATGRVQSFSETHVMRHFTHNEIAGFAKATGFELLASRELLTGAEPSRTTWGVWFTLRKT